MNKIVTASEANRRFSKLLKLVEKGEAYTITNHGDPVAHIVPIEHKDAASRDDTASRDKAWRELLARLRSQPAMNSGPWTRDELYDDDPA